MESESHFQSFITQKLSYKHIWDCLWQYFLLALLWIECGIAQSERFLPSLGPSMWNYVILTCTLFHQINVRLYQRSCRWENFQWFQIWVLSTSRYTDMKENLAERTRKQYLRIPWLNFLSILWGNSKYILVRRIYGI